MLFGAIALAPCYWRCFLRPAAHGTRGGKKSCDCQPHCIMKDNQPKWSNAMVCITPKLLCKKSMTEVWNIIMISLQEKHEQETNLIWITSSDLDNFVSFRLLRFYIAMMSATTKLSAPRASQEKVPAWTPWVSWWKGKTYWNVPMNIDASCIHQIEKSRDYIA